MFKFTARKKLLIAIISLSFLVFSNKTQAADYSIGSHTIYEIQESGKTLVTQNMNFKNLSPNIIIPQYTLTFHLQKIQNVQAFDEKGPLKIGFTEENNSTKIIVYFDDRPLKSQKSINWTLIYETEEIAKKEGQIWEIVIPQRQLENEGQSYGVTLKVPKSFGDENYIAPTPKSKTEDLNFYEYVFDENNLVKETINASFGGAQVYSVKLKYHLSNPTEEKVYTEITLPPDKENQEVYFESLNPEPILVEVDSDGNYLARYNLNPKEQIEVSLTGKIKVFPQKHNFKDSGEIEEIPEKLKVYLEPQKYWESNDEEIVNKAKEITQDKETAAQKAKAIFDYVVSTLKYNDQKIDENAERLGAKGALENPENAVCIEFADLFIALSRAIGIPAREINGYAHDPEEKFQSDLFDVLHAWVEIYIPSLGWIQIDPTWSAPPSTIELFSKFDTKHLTFVTKGLNSEFPYPAGAFKTEGEKTEDVIVEYAEVSPNLQPELETTFNLPEVLNAGLWNNAQLIVKNTGPKTLYETRIGSSLKDLELEISTDKIEVLPPFASKEIPIKIRSQSFLREGVGSASFQFKVLDRLQNEFEFKAEQEFEFVPLWKNLVFPLALLIFGFTAFMVFMKVVEYVDKRKEKSIP